MRRRERRVNGQLMPIFQDISSSHATSQEKEVLNSIEEKFKQFLFYVFTPFFLHVLARKISAYSTCFILW
jgi:tRNA(Phe) wybutosine-synthesizing methylase Tyw3